MSKPKKSLKPLTKEQQKLVLDHMPLVSSLAGKIRKGKPANVMLEDLMSAGSIGLCEAASSFDPLRGVKFITLAYQRVHGAMVDELRRLLGRGGVGYEQGKAALTDYTEDNPALAARQGDDGNGALRAEDVIEVSGLLDGISVADRALVSTIYNARTDGDAARSLGYSRASLSKKKMTVMKKLRRVGGA